jgi:hypothetical protein
MERNIIKMENNIVEPPKLSDSEEGDGWGEFVICGESEALEKGVDVVEDIECSLKCSSSYRFFDST